MDLATLILGGGDPIKVLFLIHDLGNGGAEKVLINLVNHMDSALFDITVMTLFGGGNQEKRLAPHIEYRSLFSRSFPGNSKLLKLLTPERLHRLIIHNHFDVEIAYLEGPDSRLISGCRDKRTLTVNWVHGELDSRRNASRSFRSDSEAEKCYNIFDRTVCVSETVRQSFISAFNIHHPCEVLYNTVESDVILRLAEEETDEIIKDNQVNIVTVGTLKQVKGYNRLLGAIKRLNDRATNIHLYIIGEGPQRNELELYVLNNGLTEKVTFLGYQSNPYKYVSRCDVYVCSSYREGFSTAVTESLIVGTPVVSTCCSGAYELLGDNNEYGVVVENSEEGIYCGLKSMITDQQLRIKYAKKAAERGKLFSTEKTVKAVEEMLLSL